MKVSAIVSAYYAERFISGRFDDLLMQEPMPEIVVVCQRDSAEYAIAQEYAVDWAAHDIIKIIPTLGIPTIYEAWNIGIKAARGEYVTSANSDDRLKPGALRVMAGALDAHPEIGLVFTCCELCNEQGLSRPWRRISDRTGEWLGAYRILQKRSVIGPMPMWRKSLHARHGYFADYRHAGDYEWWLRLAKAGERFWYIEDPMGIYLARHDSDEHRNQNRSNDEAQEIKRLYAEAAA